MSAESIVLAGGGTGGHISPGIAIAERLAEIAPAFDRVFACSTRPVDARMLEHVGADFMPIPAEGLSPRPLKLVRFMRAFVAGRAAARELLAERGARAVIALGGYVTGPVVHAAHAMKVPVLLVNLDATPGKANRWVAKRAARVLTACATPSMPGFAERIVGMPVRRAALAPAPRAECMAKLGLEPGFRTLLVTGASQGATSLNDLLLHLLTHHRGAFGEWQVVHLVGNAERGPIEQAYRDARVRAKVIPFLHEMGLAWGVADLALSRAGANSVAEAILNAVPTVFAPYPYHADLHQKWNAAPYHDEGVAVLCDDRIEAVKNMPEMGQALIGLMGDHGRREAMRSTLAARAREDAAVDIAHAALELAARG
ncbi:MAG: UDP-N-acetylglucosamine--N-acetylmuramyl-(pentapeptide) pyrophosphoryl-undecaprenol [Planctomycetota bacterium]|jgi:UDP-N-acetylglucosamine--N-acetylmuramyl-(pentapeptide) pyrophosphoryl-undecaprenol N-acetylglucosamine transferase